MSTHDFSGTERYVVKRRIGEGAMGVVYEAWDRKLKSRVALKTLRRAEAKSLYRFKKEFRAIQHIRHENLVRLGELVSKDGFWFFTMEFIDGVDFLTWVRSDEGISADDPSQLPFDEERLRAALPQLARAIAALHRANIVHRDIKPGNINVTPEGRLVLLDFGLIAETTGEKSTATSVVGTVTYMAPEQAYSEAVGPPADWYALGSVLYHALTGRRPFEGKSAADILMKKQLSDPRPPYELVPFVPGDLDQLCLDLMSPHPQDRPLEVEIMDRLGIDDADESTIPPQPVVEQTLFVGRTPELERLKGLFDDVCDHSRRSVVALLHGSSGVGKSELARRFADLQALQHIDSVVLFSRCYEREAVPYKAFDGLADRLSRYMVRLRSEEAAALLPLRACLLPQLFPVLSRVQAIAEAPPEEVSHLEPQQRRRRMFGAFRELLSRIAQRHALLVVIDDFQWRDADSLVLLDELMRPPEEPRVMLLLILRAAPGADPAESVGIPLNQRANVESLALDVLSPTETREMVKAIAAKSGRTLDDETVAGLIDETGGHPRFVRELMLYRSREGCSDEFAGLDAALQARITTLPTEARDLLDLLCVAGVPVADAELMKISGLDPARYEEASKTLSSEGLARLGSGEEPTIETYHDRVRETVVAHLDEQRQRDLHRRVAQLFEQSGQDPETLIRHLAAIGDVERAAEHAEEAALKADSASAYDKAVEFYRTALELRDEQSLDSRRLRVRLAEALVRAGRGPEAAELFMAVASGADALTRRNCQRQAAEQWLSSGYLEQGMKALESLLAEVGLRLPQKRFDVLASLLWQRLKLRLRGIKPVVRPDAEISEETRTRLEVYRAASHTLGMIDNVRSSVINVRYLLLALKSGSISHMGRALAAESMYQGSRGGRGLPRAAMLSAIVAQLSARHPENQGLGWWATMSRAGFEYFSGRFAVCAELLHEVDDIYRSAIREHWEINSPRLVYIFSMRHAGLWARLRTIVENYIVDAERRGDRFMETTLRRYSTFLWLASDDPDGAVESLGRASWYPPAGGFHLQHWFELEARAELALYCRDDAALFAELESGFEAMGRTLLMRIQIIRVIYHKLRGRIMLAQANQQPGQSSLVASARQAARKLESEGVEYADLYAAMLQAGIHSRCGERQATIEALKRSALLANRARMSMCGAASRYWLARLRDDGTLAAVETELAGQGVVSCEDLSRMLVPGVFGLC